MLESIPKKDKKEIAEKLKDATNDEMNMQNLAAKLAHPSASRLGPRSWMPPVGRPSGVAALLSERAFLPVKAIAKGSGRSGRTWCQAGLDYD